MLTHYCFKDVLPKRFCDGVVSLARELDSKEAEVFKEGLLKFLKYLFMVKVSSIIGMWIQE